MNFVHLHNHTTYSGLDGVPLPIELTTAAAKLGQPAVAITDHGSCGGHYDAFRHNPSHIQIIYGCEMYVATENMADRIRNNYHLVLLAQNAQGLENLYKLVTIANEVGFYYVPRIDREVLLQYSDGIIALSGCLRGEANQHLINNEEQKAINSLRWYQECFPNRFFLEFQSHNIAEMKNVYPALKRIGEQLGIPPVVTNDVHYIAPDDQKIQQALWCIRTKSTMSNPKIRCGDSYYLRTTEEMYEIFGDTLPDGLSNTVKIANMCDPDIKMHSAPPFLVPAFHENPADVLWSHIQRGVKSRDLSQYQDRLQYEFDIICDMGFPDYFLIVEDVINYMKSKGIIWNIRGSGAGSLVAFALGITHLNPMLYGLKFERFLNKDRVASMPDIDIDVPSSHRDDVIQYIVDKYGYDYVAQIIAVGRFGIRRAIRDIARVQGVPLRMADRLAKSVSSESPVLDLDNNAIAKQIVDTYPDLELANLLVGRIRNFSTHAAGVVVGDRPLNKLLPLCRPIGGGDLHLSQFDMKCIDAMGLLKLDILGLTTLDWIQQICNQVNLDFEDIPLDDPATFMLLSEGRTTGVFQVESEGMRAVLRQMRPQKLSQVSDAIALYRPGPKEQIPQYIAAKNGDITPSYLVPEMEQILGDTYGICVYQEQVMSLAQMLAGYTASEADVFRKDISKKNAAGMERHHRIFIKQVTKKYGVKKANLLWEQIKGFARYGFNRAHATDYAAITIITAYLKQHFPGEFWCALIAAERDNTKRGTIIAKAKKAGIRIVVDVCQAQEVTTMTKTDESITIFLGLRDIAQIPVTHAQNIVSARGIVPFVDLRDFLCRVSGKHMNARTLTFLAKSGALDSLYPNRTNIINSASELVKYGRAHKSKAQMPLFETDALPISSSYQPTPPALIAQYEKEAIGCYLTSHPFSKLEQMETELLASKQITHRLQDITVGQRVAVVGIVTRIHTLLTKKGRRMCFVTLSGIDTEVSVTVFPNVLANTQRFIKEGNSLIVNGYMQRYNDKVSLVAQVIQSAE